MQKTHHIQENFRRTEMEYVKCNLCNEKFNKGNDIELVKARHEERHTRGLNFKSSELGGGNNIIGKVVWISGSIITKDCCVCDACNKQLTDENFVALQNCVWYTGDLYCQACVNKYNPDFDIVMVISEGQDLSHTELANPIIVEFG